MSGSDPQSVGEMLGRLEAERQRGKRIEHDLLWTRRLLITATVLSITALVLNAYRLIT